MVDERDTTYSHSVLVKIAEYGGALVICGRDHHPVGMYAPMATNTELLSRLDAQLSISKPMRKRLWAAIVTAKVRAQSANLDHAPEVRSALLSMSRRVRSGDPDNIEAQAARAYWPAFFDDLPTLRPPFRRRAGDLAAEPPNNLLDYGYACIRASVARALVSAGLLPALGVKHHHRANAFCLADDLVEPLRPIVDARVRTLAAARRLDLDQPTKAALLDLLTATVQCGERSGPLQVAVGHYVASFVSALVDGQGQLAIPTAIDPGARAASSATTPPEGAEDDDECT
jgi:CRISPR-associated protein Cas1